MLFLFSACGTDTNGDAGSGGVGGTGTGGGSGVGGGSSVTDGGNYVRATFNGTQMEFSGNQPFPLDSLPQVRVTPGFAMNSGYTGDCFELTASKSPPYMGIIVD